MDNYLYTFVTIIETCKFTASILRAFYSRMTLHVHVNSTKSKINLFFHSYLNEAASPIACGNEVAFPAYTSPLKHSVFQLKGPIPRRGIAGAGLALGPDPPRLICTTISSRVSLPTRSFTRSPQGSEVFRKG